MKIKRTLKQLVSLMICIALIAAVMSVCVFTASAEEAAFAGGNGTEADPYLIETKAQLDNVRNYLDKHFKMIADVEFTEADFAEGGAFYNGGRGWHPIGDSYMNKFTGTFDGNGHVIKGLYIQYENLDDYDAICFGLFGYLEQATVKNLGMVDTRIKVATESDTVGAIAGYLNEGTIDNCYNTGNVSSYYMAGGILGAGSGTVSNCYNSGQVYCQQGRVGGIVGHFNGNIKKCYNSGTVSAMSELSYTAGGIVGETYDGTIADCYNCGDVSVDSSSLDAYAGGIIGSGENINISNCYNVGDVSASGREMHTGGILGYAYSDSITVTSCYFVDSNSKSIVNITETNSKKCTSDEMKNKSTFEGFDFESVWYIDIVGNYKSPMLINGSEPKIELLSIEVTKKPGKLNYTEGESFSKNGMKVTAYYSDGNNKEITDYTISGFGTTPGTKTITVTFSGKTDSFTVTVKEKEVSKPPVSSAVESEPPVSSTEPPSSSEITSPESSEPPASSEVTSSTPESSTVITESSDVDPIAPGGWHWWIETWYGHAIIVCAVCLVVGVAVGFAVKNKK